MNTRAQKQFGASPLHRRRSPSRRWRIPAHEGEVVKRRTNKTPFLDEAGRRGSDSPTAEAGTTGKRPEREEIRVKGVSIVAVSGARERPIRPLWEIQTHQWRGNAPWSAPFLVERTDAVGPHSMDAGIEVHAHYSSCGSPGAAGPAMGGARADLQSGDLIEPGAAAHCPVVSDQPTIFFSSLTWAW